MSIALPYLTHDELLRAEGCNKQMAIFVNYWPVWKNIYQEQHLVNSKIPAEVKELTQDEQDNHDYRQACKRCFIYLKNNETEEDKAVPEDLADYYKGEAHIILEEFTLSLIDFPRVIGLGIFKAINLALKFLDEASDKIVTRIENLPILQGIDFKR